MRVALIQPGEPQADGFMDGACEHHGRRPYVRSVLVPVALMGCVLMPVVGVVDVITMMPSLVAAVGSVDVVVRVMDGVDLVGTLVPVVVVDMVDMAVMKVVGVPVVIDRSVTAVRSVDVVVISVRLVQGLVRHSLVLPFLMSFSISCPSLRSCSSGRPWPAHLLVAVGDGVPGDVRDVFVSQRVHRLLATPCPEDKARITQDSQVLGYQRLGDPELVDQLVNALGAMIQVQHDGQAVRSAERPQQFPGLGEVRCITAASQERSIGRHA